VSGSSAKYEGKKDSIQIIRELYPEPQAASMRISGSISVGMVIQFAVFEIID
jgi:hypothetical protein